MSGISCPSRKMRLSPGAEPRRIGGPPPNDERATPGRFCTAFKASPWVPATVSISALVISRRVTSERMGAARTVRS